IQINAGATLNLGGTADALSDGVDHVDLLNNSTSTFHVTAASKNVGAIDGVGNTVVDAAVTLTAKHVRQNSLNVADGGKLKIRAGAGTAGTSVLASLNLNSTGKLDLNDSAMVVNYTGASPAATIRGYLVAGRGPAGFGNATWNGSSGIISSAASTAAQGLGGTGDGVNLAVGYAETSALPLGSYTSFKGQTVRSSWSL